MPHADPEQAKAYRRDYAERLKARDPDYQKKQYAKHREKRLAAKKAEYQADIEKGRARVRADYAKHAEDRAERQRKYRAKNRDKTNAEARASWHRNKDKRANRERRKAYYLANYERIYAYIQKWRVANPERELLYHAKRLLNEATGIRIAEIPDDIADAKRQQIMLHRMIEQ